MEMKKTYMQPQIEVASAELETFICGSQGVYGKDIGYGGVDSSGGKDPESRQAIFWDDDDDDF